MNTKTLTRLGVVAAVALLAALWIGRIREPGTTLEGHRTLVPGLKESLNDVATIRLIGAESKPLATLVKAEDGWRLRERGDYAVESTAVRAFLLKLSGAELLEAKTAKVELHKKLGVEDVSAKDAGGVRVEIEGGKGAAKLVIGRFNGQGGDGTFVRQADDPQAWLAKGNLLPEKNPAEWLKKELVDIQTTRVQSVAITREGKTLRLSKQTSAEPNYAVADVPKGRELAAEGTANAYASVLAGLRFDDVRKADEAAPPADAAQVRQVRYATFDGVVVEADAWETDGKAHARLRASLDSEAANADITRQQALDRAEYETRKAEFDAKQVSAVEAAKAGDKPADAGAKPAEPAKAEEAPAPPLAVTDSAKDREMRLGRLQKEVDELSARFTGWTFILPSYKYANINRGMEDVLKPVEAKAGQGVKAPAPTSPKPAAKVSPEAPAAPPQR